MTKSSRYFFRLTIAFINRFKLIFLAGIIIGILVFVGFEVLVPTLSVSVEKIGIVGEYTPDNLPVSIANMIGIGLTTTDKTGKAQPGIATDWVASDSGKIWTFNINKNVKWQDGSSISSNEINYNFSDATITRPDKYSISFSLKTPLSDFPVIVSKPIFKQGLLGVGNWKVVNLTLAGNYVDTLILKNSANEERIYKFYPTVDAAKLAYELGKINSLVDLIDPVPFSSWSTANIVATVDRQRYVAIFFNTGDDILTDKDIRQALSYGIDKSSWQTSRALGPISPASWAYDSVLKTYDFDAVHAKNLINGSKIDPAQKKKLKITLTTTPDLLNLANKVSTDWKKIGVDTTITVTQLVPDSYQAFLAIYGIPTDPDQYSTWHSTQTQTNITHLKDPRIDKLLEDGRLETDQTKRKAIYFDFQKYLVEDAPAAFLYYPTYYSVSKK